MIFLSSCKNTIALVNLALAVFLFGCLTLEIYRINTIRPDFQVGLTKTFGYANDKLGQEDDSRYDGWLRYVHGQDQIKTIGWMFLIMLLNTIVLSNLIVGNTVAPTLILPANLWRFGVVLVDCFALWGLGFMILAGMFNISVLLPMGAALLFIFNIIILCAAHMPSA